MKLLVYVATKVVWVSRAIFGSFVDTLNFAYLAEVNTRLAKAVGISVFLEMRMRDPGTQVPRFLEPRIKESVTVLLIASSRKCFTQGI